MPPVQEDWSKYNMSEIPHLLLTDGMNLPQQSTKIYLCWAKARLFVKFQLEDNNVLSHFPASSCNQPVWDYSVTEFFITPQGSQKDIIHNYTEIDVSPNGALFLAKIKNPNNKCDGIVDVDQPCKASGIEHLGGLVSGGYYAYLSVPWTIIDAIPNVTNSQQHHQHQQSTSVVGYPKQSTYRANFFRVDTPRGNSREYACWSPTLLTPPCFHVPNLFGYLHLQGY